MTGPRCRYPIRRETRSSTLSPSCRSLAWVFLWRGIVAVQAVNDHQVVFRMKNPSTTMPYAVSRAGDLRMISKAQWDKEGEAGFDKRMADLLRLDNRGKGCVHEHCAFHFRSSPPRRGDYPASPL